MSSAAVEGEFNKLKNMVIKNSLRADKFVEKHIEYLIGRILIADANMTGNTSVNETLKTPVKRPPEEDEQAEEDTIQNVVKNKTKNFVIYSDSDNSEPEPEVVASRETENWRGKATEGIKKRKPGKYLGQRIDEVSDALKSGPYRQVRILRNGNSLNLQPQIVEGRSITAINTCAFDSLSQSILIACIDFPIIRNFVAEKSAVIPIFKLVTEISA